MTQRRRFSPEVRERAVRLVREHQSEYATQYLSIRYSERLAEAGVEVSVGSKGDAYDNALAESVIGLFKTEVIRPAGPWRGLDDVEYATLESDCVGVMVQHSSPTRTAWLSSASGVRSTVSRAVSRTPDRNNCGWSTQITEPPMNPGRFNPRNLGVTDDQILGMARR